MDTKNSQFVVKLLPSMRDFVFLMPFFFLFGRMNGLKTLMGDCDTGWHIRTGEWILAHHTVPTHDIFSYSRPGGAWFAWEWLTDIIWAFLYHHGGLATVGAAALLIIGFTGVLLFGLVRKRSNAVVAVLVTLTAVVCSSMHWLARPHLFTLLFVVLFCSALENVRAGKPKFHGIPYLVLLPVATILWTNLHGGFFVGAMLVAMYGVGEALRLLVGPETAEARSAILARAARYLWCSLACLAASLVNPYGYHLHQHVVQYLFDPYESQHIIEFLSVSFHHPLAIFFEILLFVGVLTAIRCAAKGSFTEAVLLGLWGHAALLSVRNIPIFAVIAAPQIAAAVQEWLTALPQLEVAGWLRRAAAKYHAAAERMSETDQIPRWHVVSALAALVVIGLSYAPNPPAAFRAEFDPKKFPVAAVPHLKLDASSRIFTTDQWGDYLIYQLYPKTKVFVDGRSDYYGSDFCLKYLDVIEVQHGWNDTLSRFAVDTILMPVSTPLAGVLKESPRWRVVYDDGVAVAFRLQSAGGTRNSLATGEGNGRDREITKTQASDQRITPDKTKT